MNILKHKIANFLIVIKSLWTTFKYACIVICRASSCSRQAVDRYVRAWSNTLLKIVDATLYVRNPHNINLDANRPYLLMSNHSSLYDIPIIFETFPKDSVRMIAKKELFRIPIFGRAIKLLEILAIDRKNSAQAMKDLEQVRQKMQSGIIPWIAPEGTRSRDGKLGPFKKGGFMLAIQTGAIIVPITIRGAADILPAKTLDFRTHQQVDVIIGEPIDASQYTVENRMALLEEVRKRIEDNLGFKI